MQREAADLLRRSVDSECHEHFDVLHGSANDVLGSINIKALMDNQDKYYDIRPAPQGIQELISDFGKGEKDKFFDIRKYTTDLQQEKGAYEMIYSLTSTPREVIKPDRQTVIELVQQTASSNIRSARYKRLNAVHPMLLLKE
jgi:hypothetical protein